MKRVALQNSKFVVFAALTSILSSILFSAVPTPSASAASAGANQCIQNVSTATGVTVFQDLGYCWIAFRTVGSYTWTPPSTVTEIDLLVVAGGGGGGSRHAGGGGAGGVISNLGVAINSTDLSISVGAGGAGGAAASTGGNTGSNGADSIVSGGGIATRTAVGGGGGGYGGAANSGGSGGGGGSSSAGGSATSGQGFAGSAGLTDGVNYWVGGGGGGAGAAGGAASSTKGGNGGAGTQITWLSTNAYINLGVGRLDNDTQKIYIAGGGSGGTDRDSIPAGIPTVGGGGYGATGTGDATAGAANSGGGGGGSGISGVGTGSKKGGDGGSGAVLIRYTIAKVIFKASDYTSGSTAWPNAVTGGTAGTAPSGGMTKSGSLISAVTFSGKESSNSDQITSSLGSLNPRDTVTVEMWIKLKDSGSAQNASGSMLFSWSASNFNIYHYGDQVGFNTFNNQLYGIDSTSFNNVWTHLVFVMTDTGPWSTLKIYANGALQNPTCRVTPGNCTSAQVRTIDNSGNFILMDNAYSANTWNAKADVGLVRIYENELTSAKVAALYSATQPDYTLPAQLIGNPTLTGDPLKGKSITLSVTAYVPGRVTFTVNGKRIAGCIGRATSGSSPNYSASCLWKPSTTGRQELVATVSSSDNSYDPTRSSPLVVFAGKRTDRR